MRRRFTVYGFRSATMNKSRKFVFILWLITVSLTAPLVKARPRNVRQAGSVPTACTSRERLVDHEGTFTSPNFPGPYPANSSCVWIITPPQNTNLSLEFTSFDIQSNAKQCGGNKCHCDFVQVKELDPPPNSAGFSAKFCNDNRPRRIINNLMSRVRIRFVSDLAEEQTGFKLTYKTFQSTPTTAPGGGAGVSVNQTVATTIAGAASNITDGPTQPGSPQNLNSSGYSIPLSTFTSQAQVNATTPESNGSVILPPGKVSSPVAPTPFPRTFPVTSTGGESVWTTATHVVIAVEQKEVEEKVPDIIILGPSVPVVLIFVIVVAAIAWWNYKFNSEELNRYESYAKNSAAKKRQIKTMKNISKGNLYNEMTKNWRGQSFNAGPGRSSPMVGRYRKISFAGKLLELAEGVRTPRPSRPPSEETVPLNKPSSGSGPFLSPGGPSTGGGSRPSSRPSSRPASLLLRDALITMFGGTDEGEAQTQESGSPSKRASKRVSFVDEEAGQPLIQNESSPPERIQEKNDEPVEDEKPNEEPDAPVKPSRPLQIPAILVRQPSEDCESPWGSPHDDEIFVEESPDLQAALPEHDADDEDEDDDDYGARYPDSSLEDIPDRSLIFPDLEDFLLNLDKDSPLDEPPYSCASHIRDILRKSYGDEGPSSLGAEAVMTVPEEFLGMIRNSPQSHGGAAKETDQVDDVD
ncbi:uncharacterized protein LOC144634775 [Oculina patagonica]